MSWDQARELVLEVLEQRDKHYQAKRYGPFALRLGQGWAEHLERDANPRATLKQRLLAIEGIESLDCGPANGAGHEVELVPVEGQ